MELRSERTHSLGDLEWPEVTQAIAARTLSDLGRARALALGPAPDQDTAELRLRVLSEVLALAKEGATLPARMVVDVAAPLGLVARGSIASGKDLASVLRLIRVARDLYRFGRYHEEKAPLLGDVLTFDPAVLEVEQTLADAVNEEGEILDTASPGLGQARAEKKKLQNQMRQRVQELIGKYREALQDGFFAERDGRMVLPVRSDAPFRVEGIVLGTSASGSTLYVEPKELGQLGNQLGLCEANIEREIALVLSDLSALLAPFSEELCWVLDVAVRADLLRACGLFSEAISAVVVPFGESGVLSLKRARHPLLCLRGINVVENDLCVAPEQGLILSGPNAGGKTVALKTLGLLALMQATGLPLPAHEESRVGFFDEVLCDIGDDQSLSMSLSTFSGHVERVRDIMEVAAHGTLVLFDELMGGTDPDEGAALAIATIDRLVSDGASVCVTTHYEPLKLHAAQAKHLENGAVGFDFDAMGPTFRVEMGRPGASSALIVASRHGLLKSVTDRAEQLLPEVIKKHRKENLGLEVQAVLLEKERASLQAAREAQEAETRRLSLQVQKLEETRRKLLAQETDGLRSEVRAARGELRSLRQKLRGAGAESLKELSDELARIGATVALGSAVDQEVRAVSPSSGLSAEVLRPKTKVKVQGFSQVAEVLEAPKDGQVRVLVGVIKMSVPLAQLSLLDKSASEKGSKQNKAGKSSAKKASLSTESLSVHREAPPVRSVDVTLDLRGVRVEEGLLQTDSFIDELLKRQERGGFILHGHGTGAMKEAVRSHLGSHVCVREARAAEREEGGDAFTVFWLSGG